MNRCEQLKQELDTLHMPETLYNKTLDAMRTQKKRRVSLEGFGRWAAITAAVAVLALGGSFMWRYLFGDLNPGPGMVTPPAEGSPASAPTLETDIRPEITFFPAIEYHIIKGDPPGFIMDGDGRELPRGDQTMVFYDMDELRRFIYEYNIDDGFIGVDRHGISDYIDFSRKMVIAAFGFGSSSPVLLPPVVAADGQTLDIYRRAEPYDQSADDVILRGYFLVVDRGVIREARYHTDGETIHDFTSDRFIDSEIPSLPDDVCVYWGQEMLGQGYIYFVPDDGVAIRFSFQSTVAIANKVTFGSGYNSSVTAFSPEHMTGITATLTNSPYTLWLDEENGRFSIIIVSEKDWLYKTAGYASVGTDGVWSIEWLDGEPPPPETSPNPPDYDPVQLDMSQLIIDINWPEPVVYTPEFNAFPLTSAPQVYKTHMLGPITFVDARFNPIALPFEPAWYTPIRNETGVVAYALGHDGENVLMLADGTLPRGADGDYIYMYDHYEHSFYAIGSLVFIARTTRLPDDGGTRSLHGLYDMDSRRVILPCEYDTIEFVEGQLLYAVKDGASRLLDAKGDALYSFTDTLGIDTPHRQSWDSHYYIDTEERLFCKIPVIDGKQFATLERFGAYYVVRDGGGSITGPLYVFDASGLEVHRAEHYWHVIGDSLIIIADVGFDVMDKSGTVRHFPYAVINQVVSANLDGDEVYWTEYDRVSGKEQSYAVDEAGNVRDADQRQAATGWNGSIDGPVYCDYNTYLYSIRDANGHILLETEEYLGHSGNFVVRFRYIQENWQPEAYAVYTLNGELLLDEIFGAIYEAPAPGGGMFIYLDADTCVLLYKDGRTEPVPNAPVAEKVWYGG